MKPIIEVRKLSKKYYIKDAQKYYTLRDSLVELTKNPVKYFSNRNTHTFWALKNINFNVKKGEIVGIIGQNGAGKSTLLKILSRITPPTEGHVILRGKVSSLLEVGTGFHLELTGRENIFLNGAILGMTRKEIQKKYNEIVEFSGVGEFIETAVKYYSSGMFTRLAFSVAAYLEPDILIVDEVLSVGDAEFQKKSLGKMEEASKQGRTVLFVSHNLLSIEKLCKRTILLEKGSIKMIGDTKKVITSYLNTKLNTKTSFGLSNAPGNEHVKLLSCSILDIRDQLKSEFDLSESIIMEMKIIVLNADVKVTPSFHIKNNSGDYIFVSSDIEAQDKKHQIGEYRKRCVIPAHLLAPGIYFAGPSASTILPKNVHFFLPDLVMFKITERLNFGKKSARGSYMGEIPGYIRPILVWKSNLIKKKSQ